MPFLLQVAPFPVVGIDGGGRICFCNDVAAAMCGRRIDDLVGRPLPDQEPFAHLRPLWDEVRAGGAVAGRTFHLLVDGREVELECTAVAAPGQDVVLFFGRDVTAQTRSRAELLASQERLHLALAAARMGIWEWDVVVDRVHWSPEVEELFGAAPGSFPPDFRSFLELVHPDDRQALGERVQQALAPGAPRYEIQHRAQHRDGRQLWVRCTGLVMRAPDGTPVRMVGTVADVTAVQGLEDQLRQAQKMESIGRLAGGIAHDFNNLLTVVLGEADLLERRARAVAFPLEGLANLREAAVRGQQLTQQLLTFARRQHVDMALLDPADLLVRLEPVLRRLAGADVRMRVRIVPPMGMVCADASQLEQVLMNLVVNAREAMPRGGDLTITADQLEVAAGVDGAAPPGRWLRYRVADTGVGIATAVRQRLFEPFFSTKPTGTGIGLSTCYGIVAQCGGRILVDSEPGAGATFTVLLPQVASAAVAASAPVASSPPPPAAVMPGRPRLLVVDDDDLARDVANRVLQRAGFEVQVAGSAEEAYALAAQQPFEMLVTDVVMPGVDGVALADRMQSAHPAMKVLYVSGHSERRLARQGVRRAFLAKPYSPDALAARVREVLAGSGSCG